MKKTVIIGALFTALLGISYAESSKPNAPNFENSFEPEYSAVLVVDSEEKVIENQTITSSKADSNGGQAYVTVNNQNFAGSLCAKEKDSLIQVKSSRKKNTTLKKLKGNGKITIK